MTVNLVNTKVIVGTEATLLLEVSDYGSSNKDGRTTYQVVNNGSTTLFIGDDSVSTSTGMPFPAGASLALNLRFGAKVYAISDIPSQDVRIMKVS